MSYAVQQVRSGWQPGALAAYLSEFSTFRGRLNRARYWLSSFVLSFAYLLVGLMLMAPLHAEPSQALAIVIGIVWTAAAIGFGVCGCFVAIRRLHDRNMSGHWLWLFGLAPPLLTGFGGMAAVQGPFVLGVFLTLVGLGVYIWGIVEIGFLRGTVGANRFGSDPLQELGRA